MLEHGAVTLRPKENNKNTKISFTIAIVLHCIMLNNILLLGFVFDLSLGNNSS